MSTSSGRRSAPVRDAPIVPLTESVMWAERGAQQQRQRLRHQSDPRNSLEDDLASLFVLPTLSEPQEPELCVRSPKRSPSQRQNAGGGGDDARVRTGTVMSLSGLGSTAADFVTRMERLSQEELAGHWRRLEQGMRSESALRTALEGTRTDWNPYRPARGGANLRQEILNSELAEFKSLIPTDALFVKGDHIARGPAEAPRRPARGSPSPADNLAPAAEDEVLVKHGCVDLTKRPTVAALSTRALADSSDSCDSSATPVDSREAIEKALFAALWQEVAVPVVAQILLTLSSHDQPVGEAKASDSPAPLHSDVASGEHQRRRRVSNAVADPPLSLPLNQTSTGCDENEHRRRHHRGSALETGEDPIGGAGDPLLTPENSDGKRKGRRRPTTCNDGRPPSHPFTAEIAPLPLGGLQDKMRRRGLRREGRASLRMVFTPSSASSTTTEAEEERQRALQERDDEAMVFEDVHGGSSVAASPKHKVSSRQTTGRRPGDSAPSSATSTTRSCLDAHQRVSSLCNEPSLTGTGQPPLDSGGSSDGDSTGWELRPGTTNSALSAMARAAVERKGSVVGQRPSVHYGLPDCFQRPANEPPPPLPQRFGTTTSPPSPPLNLRNEQPSAATQDAAQEKDAPPPALHGDREQDAQALSPHRGDAPPPPRQGEEAAASTMLAANAASSGRTPLYGSPMRGRFAPYGAIAVARPGQMSPERRVTGVGSARVRQRNAQKSNQGTRLPTTVSPILRAHPQRERRPSPQTLSNRRTNEVAAVYLSPERRPTVAKRHNSPLPIPRAPGQLSQAPTDSSTTSGLADDQSSQRRRTPKPKPSQQRSGDPVLRDAARPGPQRAPGDASLRSGVGHVHPGGGERHVGSTTGTKRVIAETTPRSAVKAKKQRPTTAYL